MAIVYTTMNIKYWKKIELLIAFKIENFFLEISVAWKLRDGVHFV